MQARRSVLHQPVHPHRRPSTTSPSPKLVLMQAGSVRLALGSHPRRMHFHPRATALLMEDHLHPHRRSRSRPM